MPRSPGLQIIRNPRKDGSITFGLRVRIGGVDEVVPLGNTNDGWDEARVDVARKQLLAKIELGLWTPGCSDSSSPTDEEPSFRELATDWLEDRRRNPAIRPKTIELNESQLTRYLLPFFGDLLPSQITPQKIKDYRRRIHEDNGHIRAAAEAGKPLIDPHTHHRIRTLGNESINKTLRVLAQILDEAEDATWIDRNPARSRRMREPLERRRRAGALDLDEFLSLLEAASHLDRRRHSTRTLERAAAVRALRDDAGLDWKTVCKRLKLPVSTAFYLYGSREPEPGGPVVGPRRAVVATLGLSGPRVTEFCQLDNKDVDLTKARFFVQDSKTEAGIRDVDIHGRLLSELRMYHDQFGVGEMDAPAFPSLRGNRRNKDNVRLGVINPVVQCANEIRAGNEQPPIHVHVTPHTFRRTYITYMLAAGHDIPYVQSQVGHVDPTVTLAVYAQLIRRTDRERLRQELRDFLDTPVASNPASPAGPSPARLAEHSRADMTAQVDGLRRAEKAGKGMRLSQ
jgi:integrase